MNTTTTPTPTQPRPSASPIMPFGKYKGSLLKDLPSEYLLWLGCLHDLRQPLLGAVLREMWRRIVEMDQQTAAGGDANAGG